jgi:hypothetical protein
MRMNTSAILGVLQAAAILLTAAQGRGVSTTTMQNAVFAGDQAVQLALQVANPIPFAVTPNTDIWPTIGDVTNSAYRDSSGKWVRLSSNVALIPGDTSFGDLNGDGYDDAAVIINKPTNDGSAHYYLDALINQNNILFDAAEYPLGSNIIINSHQIENNKIVINGVTYELVGNALMNSQ